MPALTVSKKPCDSSRAFDHNAAPRRKAQSPGSESRLNLWAEKDWFHFEANRELFLHSFDHAIVQRQDLCGGRATPIDESQSVAA